MNKEEKEFIKQYERQLRKQRVFDRFSYYQFAKRLVNVYPMVAYSVLADKLKEMAIEQAEEA